MKLIYLEAEEEITSVIDKIGKVSDTQITLVVPKGGNLIQSIVNLKLLKKHAGMAGKDLTIVTSDPIGINLAKRAGLTAQPRVQTEVGEALELTAAGSKIRQPKSSKSARRIKSYREIEAGGAGIKKPTREKIKVSAPKGKHKAVSLVSKKKFALIVIIILAVLAAAAGAAYWYLPKATIAVSLKTETITNDVLVTISKSAATVDLDKNVIPGEIYEVELSDEIEKEATAEKDIGRKAQGTVTIYNTYQTTPRILVPSRLEAADGKVFRTLESVTIPGYTDSGGGNKAPGTVTVAVEADQPGEEYNLAPGNFRISALPADVQKDLYGKSSSAMVGGSSRLAKVVSGEDLEKAEKELLQKLAVKAVADFSRDDLMIFPEGMTVKVVDYKPTPAKDEEAEKFKLAIKASFKFMAFKKDDMLAVAADDIETVLPADKFLVGGEDDQVSFSTHEEKIETGELQVYFHASKSFARAIDKDLVRQEVMGLSAEQISERLRNRESINGVEANFWPFWVKKAPFKPNRIIVDISID
jgi:hypothetical protein